MKYEEKMAKVTVACAGIVVPCTSEEVYPLFQEIAETITGHEVDDCPFLMQKFRAGDATDNEFKACGITAYTLLGEYPCICVLLGDANGASADFPDPLTEDYGTGFPSAFCYVYNIRDPWCSEFGDVFFQKFTLGELTYYTKAR